MITTFNLTITITDVDSGESDSITAPFQVDDPNQVGSSGVFRLALGGRRMGGQATVDPGVRAIQNLSP